MSKVGCGPAAGDPPMAANTAPSRSRRTGFRRSLLIGPPTWRPEFAGPGGIFPPRTWLIVAEHVMPISGGSALPRLISARDKEMTTPELVWEGKYGEDGRKTAPVKVALPFQTVETVNESAQERQRSLDLFGGG